MLGAGKVSFCYAVMFDFVPVSVHMTSCCILHVQVQRHLDSIPTGGVVAASLVDEEESGTVGGTSNEIEGEGEGEEESEGEVKNSEDPEGEHRGVPLDVILEEGTPRGTPDLMGVGGTCGEEGGEDDPGVEKLEERIMEEKEGGVKLEAEKITDETRMMETDAVQKEGGAMINVEGSTEAGKTPDHMEKESAGVNIVVTMPVTDAAVSGTAEIVEIQGTLVTTVCETEPADTEGAKHPVTLDDSEAQGVPDVTPPSSQLHPPQSTTSPGTEPIVTATPVPLSVVTPEAVVSTAIPLLAHVPDHHLEELREVSQSPQSSVTSENTPEPQQAVLEPSPTAPPTGLLQKYTDNAVERRRSEGDAFVSSHVDQRSPSPQQFKAVSSGTAVATSTATRGESPLLKRGELSPTPSNDSESSSDSKPPLPPLPYNIGDRVGT